MVQPPLSMKLPREGIADSYLVFITNQVSLLEDHEAEDYRGSSMLSGGCTEFSGDAWLSNRS